MAVPKKKKSYTKCTKKYVAWRNTKNKNLLISFTYCNVCFNLTRKGLHLKTNMECLFCLQNDLK